MFCPVNWCTALKQSCLNITQFYNVGGILDRVDSYVFTGALCYSFVRVALPLYGVWLQQLPVHCQHVFLLHLPFYGILLQQLAVRCQHVFSSTITPSAMWSQIFNIMMSVTLFAGLELELVAGVVWEKNTVGWLVAGSWCWSGVRGKHCWAGGCWSCRTEWSSITEPRFTWKTKWIQLPTLESDSAQRAK